MGAWRRLRSLFGTPPLQGYGVIGGGPDGPLEIEGSPGFSLTLGQLPGVELKVIHTLRSGIPEAGLGRKPPARD